MNRLLLLLFILLSSTIQAQERHGWSMPNGKYIWKGEFENDSIPAVESRDKLLAKLGSSPYVRISPVQPTDKVVGRIEGIRLRSGMMAPTYNFGFVVDCKYGGYTVKATDVVMVSGRTAIPMEYGSKGVMQTSPKMDKYYREQNDVLKDFFNVD